MLALPVAAILMMVLFFGRHTIYSWSRPGVFLHEPAVAGKVHYLNTFWVFARMAIALLLWTLFAWLLRKTSVEQDRKPHLSLVLHRRLTRYAVMFVLVFAFTFTLGAFDWLVSLDPQWFTTMFAVYVFAGPFVQGIPAVTLPPSLLKKRGSLPGSLSHHSLPTLSPMPSQS